ncbi:GH1 family beta-glucosidase [Alteromonas sp. ASW11-130]|uniref:GH1 family beta-glucosidase n=1 Tax=Alteromonas sp. ASW11-130 TaxID=3015775 RepID=UPI002242192F|nr:GH1 family beta-glucosidase [Alteromonas sp. ASW11-130]MCW8093166.1 GH1 family beta-glucosidase [Alteromonas sp. ASW11-130]
MSNRLILKKQFQSNTFTFGVATSSFQIEGAVESREESIWDRFCQQPGKILDGSNGNEACDHVNRWQEDLDIIDSLHVDAYRFSISWPRIIRADGSLNQQGLDFYLAILGKLKAKGIKAYVTLYHWDLPQYLEDEGGWLNRDTAYAFKQYVEVVVKAFGDLVYSYATLNEPFCSAYLGYEVGIHAPGKAKKEYGKKAIHHLLLAHGLAMKVLRQHAPKAESGIVLNFTPFYPASNSEEDAHATRLAHVHFNDWYIRPILEGEYPALIDDIPESHRPIIAPGDLDIISQPIDYLGVNYYTRARVKSDAPRDPILLPAPETSEQTAMGWEVYPQGLTDLLLQLERDFRLPPIIITENGLASDDHLVDGEVNDLQRIRYLQSHMDAVAEAMAQGVNITGYFVWSLLDNFEWALGYEKRFGIVYVDYTTQKRTLKNSAIAFRNALLSRQ